MKSLKISLLFLVAGVVGELKSASADGAYEYEAPVVASTHSLYEAPQVDPHALFEHLFEGYLQKKKGSGFTIATSVQRLIEAIAKNLEHVTSLTYINQKDLDELAGLRAQCIDALRLIHHHLIDGEGTKSLTHKRMVDNLQKIEAAVAVLEKVKEDVSHVVFHFRKNDETQAEQQERVKQKERELFDIAEQKRMQDLLAKFLAQARERRSENLYSNTNTHEPMGWELLASPHVSDEVKRMVRGYMPKDATKRGIPSSPSVRGPEAPARSNQQRFAVPSDRHEGEMYIVGAYPAHETIHSSAFGL